LSYGCVGLIVPVLPARHHCPRGSRPPGCCAGRPSWI